MKLKPCPKCGGEVKLYSVCKMDINYNCFAKCQKCKEKYILPYIDFKLSGVTIHKDSIKEAEKAWNNRKEECSCSKFGESTNSGMKCSNCGREL